MMKLIHCGAFAGLAIVHLCSFSQEVVSDPTPGCIKALAEKPELAVLKSKLPFAGDTNPTLEMLANRNKPTKVEKAAISTYVSLSENCVQQGQDWRTRNWPPNVNAVVERYTVWGKSLFADLYSGQITYGDYSRKLTAELVKFKAELSAIAEKLQAEQQAAARQREQDVQRKNDEAQQRAAKLQREQQAQDEQARAVQAQNAFIAEQNEKARRAALAQQLFQMQAQQAAQQQQLQQQQLNSFRPPVQTNCNVFGNQVNCTTR